MMGGEEEVFGFFVARVGFLELKNWKFEFGFMNGSFRNSNQQTYVTSGAYSVGVESILC